MPYLANKNYIHIYDTELNEHVVLAGFIYKNTPEGFFDKSTKISGDGTKDSPYEFEK